LTFLLLASVLISGCAVQIGDFEFQVGDLKRLEVGELKTEEHSIPLSDASLVDLDLRMTAGELNLSGGAESLMEGEFSYNLEEWQPEISYAQDQDIGKLIVHQPLKGSVGTTGIKNQWTLQLHEETPLRVFIRLVAGMANLDFRGLSLDSLDIELGAGEVTIDLSGDWERDFSVDITRGIGEATLRLPSQVGVRVETASGLSEVVLTGLERSGDFYVNEAYGESEVTIDIDIIGAVGRVNLEVVE
jgi:hypothetical protein